MAQPYEIEAWVNPDAWDDQEAAARAIEMIAESGTDDEVVWIGITLVAEGATLATAGRDRTQAALVLEARTDEVRGMVKYLVKHQGLSEVQAAKQAGVTRMTVRSWLGK